MRVRCGWGAGGARVGAGWVRVGCGSGVDRVRWGVWVVVDVRGGVVVTSGECSGVEGLQEVLVPPNTPPQKQQPEG